MDTIAEKYSLPNNRSLDRWSNGHALVMPLAVFLSIFTSSTAPLLILASLSFAMLLMNHFQYLTQFTPFAGFANWLTFTRLLLVIFALMQFSSLSMWSFFLLMTIAVCMDVADGFVARKLSTHSTFGSVFDMEADAFFVCAMGLYFYFTTPLGLYLLIPGLLRYIYRIVLWLGPIPGFKEKKKQYAATLAGLNFVCLLTAIIIPEFWQNGLLIFSVMMVVFSFSVSFWEYFNHAKSH